MQTTARELFESLFVDGLLPVKSPCLPCLQKSRGVHSSVAETLHESARPTC